METLTENLTSVENINHLAKMLPEIDVWDSMDYKIGFGFKGDLCGDYLQGHQSWLSPRHMVSLVKEIKESGLMGFNELVGKLNEIDYKEVEKRRIRSVQNSAVLLDGHPMVQAYLLGKNFGGSAVYNGKMEVDSVESYRRTISGNSIEMAILSGAIFGGKSRDDIDTIYKTLESTMRYGSETRYGISKTFRSSAIDLYWFDGRPEKTIRYQPRFKLFEKRLYQTAINRIKDSFDEN